MRLGFTIVYNALHHLKHKDFAAFMTENFDYWSVVDGLSMNGGSTWWCNRMTSLPVSSDDGTKEFMEDLCTKHKNVMYFRTDVAFPSKDRQVNKAVDMLRTKAKQGYLWQVDADEKWTAEQLEKAEQSLFWSSGKQMAFGFNHFVGDGLVAVGKWGDAKVNRLWQWRGQRFITHEPPMIYDQRLTIESPIKFDHYSYYFEQDVAFKEKYYKGYKGMLSNWKALQHCTDFPVSLSALMPKTSPHYNESTQIIKI